MRKVACHTIEEGSGDARDLHSRVFARWHEAQWGDGLSLDSLQRMRDEILDHVALWALEDSALSAHSAREAVRTAAECGLGVLDRCIFPNGDFEIRLPLIGERLSNFPAADGSVSAFDFLGEEFRPGHLTGLTPATARTWLDAFSICLVGGLLWERFRAVGPMLRDDYAHAIRNGVPYSPLECLSDHAELIEMEILCLYLTESTGHKPTDLPLVPLRKPSPEERADAIRRLDLLDALTPDQLLLRALLVDDRGLFDQALTDRLQHYRDSAAGDTSPRSVLPMGILALAILAVQVHGWELETRSGYLPEGLLQAPPDTPPVPGV